MSLSVAKQLQSYPALEEMGIKNAQEISGYSLRPDGAAKDLLKIRYKRAKGSFLPHSRTYKFGRSLRTVIADGGTARMEHTYEISPFLLKAVAELDSLVANQKSVSAKVESRVGDERVAELLKEFNDLETMVSAHVSMTDAAAVAARFARMRAQIAAL